MTDRTGPDDRDVPRSELRAELRARRRDLDDGRRRRAAASLAELLDGLAELEHVDRLATYLPTDGELDPNRVVERLRGRGTRTSLPVVGPDRTMRFADWAEESEMAPNRFGIPEPVVDPTALHDASATAVVLVPCVATDPRGHRLGFGAGFYDRALAGARGDEAGSASGSPTVIGICWDDAVLDRIDTEPWDVAMDLVVTERRVIRPAGRGAGAAP